VGEAVPTGFAPRCPCSSATTIASNQNSATSLCLANDRQPCNLIADIDMNATQCTPSGQQMNKATPRPCTEACQGLINRGISTSGTKGISLVLLCQSWDGYKRRMCMDRLTIFNVDEHHVARLASAAMTLAASEGQKTTKGTPQPSEALTLRFLVSFISKGQNGGFGRRPEECCTEVWGLRMNQISMDKADYWFVFLLIGGRTSS